MNPDPDPGGPKTYRSDGSGSATLVKRVALHFPFDMWFVQTTLANPAVCLVLFLFMGLNYEVWKPQALVQNIDSWSYLDTWSGALPRPGCTRISGNWQPWNILWSRTKADKIRHLLYTWGPHGVKISDVHGFGSKHDQNYVHCAKYIGNTGR